MQILKLFTEIKFVTGSRSDGRKPDGDIADGQVDPPGSCLDCHNKGEGRLEEGGEGPKGSEVR